MAKTLDRGGLRPNLVRIAQDFHQRGWMPGSAGNLSARSTDHPNSFWVTASGLAKGQLEENDFLRIDIANGEIKQQPQDSTKPSAETCIHQAIYHFTPLLKPVFTSIASMAV